MRQLLSPIVLALLIAVPETTLAADNCEGIQNEHNRGMGYNFITTSRCMLAGTFIFMKRASKTEGLVHSIFDGIYRALTAGYRKIRH
jgi:hypothetical protein